MWPQDYRQIHLPIPKLCVRFLSNWETWENNDKTQTALLCKVAMDLFSRKLYHNDR